MIPSAQRSFNTFTFWEGLRLYEWASAQMELEWFQHLYLLGRSATLT
jgi:hypothetical protein